MQPTDSPPSDPLLGNSLSGILGCALDASTIPVSVADFPENWEPPTPGHIAVLLPQYQIESLIGRGGMGAVYKGRQITLQRPVAIKVLPAELARNTEFVARFHREAQLLASLSHQGIVTIFDFGQTTEGHLYFVMEYVDGTDLYRLIHKSGTQLEAKQALSLTVQICEAMQYAHDNGVVHRDIKPANVLVTRDGRAKLADFGLAMKPTDPDAIHVPPKPGAYFDPSHSPNVAEMRFTQPGAAMGTPDYAAPEVYDGKADERSDIYALGIMLYEMLTGAPPKGYFQLPSALAPVDHRVDQVVVKALEIDPAERYQKASDMRLAVEAATRPLPKRSQIKLPPTVPSRQAVTSAARVPPPAQVPPRSRPSGWFGKLVVAALMIIGVGAAYDAGQKWAMTKRLLVLVSSRPGTRLSPEVRADCQRYLDASLLSAQAITDEVKKSKAMADIAIVQAGIGEVDHAKKLAASLTSASDRYVAIAGIAAAQATLGDMLGARTTADELTDVTAKEDAFARITTALAEKGSTAEAEKFADFVADASDSKVEILTAIAEAKAKTGDSVGYRSTLERAKTLALGCSDADHRSKLHKLIVNRMAKAHDILGAQEVLKRIPNDLSHETKAQRQGALMNLAIAQAEMGDIIGANATIKSIEWFWAHDGGLMAVCERLAINGDISGALRQAEKMIHDYNKAPSRGIIAAAAGETNAISISIKGWTNDSYRRPAFEKITALLVEKKGAAIAQRWITTLSAPEDRYLCYLKLVETRLRSAQTLPDIITPQQQAATPAPKAAPITNMNPTADIAIDQAAFEKELRAYSWIIPSRKWVIEFKDNHEAKVDEGEGIRTWHWWTVGPRTLHIQFSAQPATFDATIGGTYIFDTAMTSFQGANGNPLGERHKSLVDKPAAISLFNGKDLTGWKGLTEYWSVQDGAITYKTTAAHHPDFYTSLIWKGEVRDFEFTFKARVLQGDADAWRVAGVQFRARMHNEKESTVAGYNLDVDQAHKYTGNICDKLFLNRDLTSRGNRVLVEDSKGKPGYRVVVTGTVAHRRDIERALLRDEWNDYRLRAVGDKIEAWVNGRKTFELTDRCSSAPRSGLLALSSFFGSIMTAQFKDLFLTELTHSAGILPPPSDPARPPLIRHGGHAYLFVPGHCRWDIAKARAESAGGYLATIGSREENDVLISAYKAWLPGKHDCALLGGIRKAADQPWTWVTGERFTFTAWHPGEPNSRASTAYLHLWRAEADEANWDWDDAPLIDDHATVGFIIEWEHESPALPEDQIFERELLAYVWEAPRRNLTIRFDHNHQAQISDDGTLRTLHWWITGRNTIHTHAAADFDLETASPWFFDSAFKSAANSQGEQLVVRGANR